MSDLIDVWKVTDGVTNFYTDSYDMAVREAKDIEDVKINMCKMHREVFENLPEFDGF